MSNDVQVGVKLRPLTKKEINENSLIGWIARGDSVVSLDQKTKQGDDEFHFDYVFDLDSTNSKVFNSIVKPIVDAAITGFKGTVFCYGQCNSGKTYTMAGTSEDLGLIPLSIKHILNVASTTHTECDFILRMSYSGVQDQEIHNLLDKEGIELKISNGEIIALYSSKNITNSLSNILSAIQTSIDDKSRGKTNGDNVSHTVFRIIIESWQANGDPNRCVQISELNFVELAGFKELPSANTSKEHRTDAFLLALESLILGEYKLESFQRCVSNCNDKLMELLQTSLGGNAFVVMLCTITPGAAEESHHTLSLASRIKSLKTGLRKNVNSGNTTIEVFAPLPTELLAKLKVRRIRFHFGVLNTAVTLELLYQKIQNGNLVDIGEIESRKRHENTCAIDKRIVLFERENISGCKRVYQEPIVYKSRRENWLKAAGPSRQRLFQVEAGLPTIIEMSPEKPFKKRNSMQLVDVTNRTFQAFTDFQLNLITSNKTNGGHDIRNECITINEYDMGPSKQDSAVQTSNNSLSPMPKNILRKFIADRAKAFTELLEFTDLENSITELTARKEKNNCYYDYLEYLSRQQIDRSSVKNNSLSRMEEENMKLVEDLKLKNEELNEIKNDFQSLKSDLEQTICLLTNENAELLHSLSVEKERLTETESNHRKMIDELQTRILEITKEKMTLENEVTTLNVRVALSPKTSAKSNDEQLITQYNDEIAVLKAENIESSKENKELEDIKESKLLQYEHECIYKSKVSTFTERCEYLAAENEKLLTELVTKNEENEVLKEENKILSDKISLLETTNAHENDMEQLRSQNNVLRRENMELKMKVMMLADESMQFSGNLLDTMDSSGNMRNRNLNDNKSHLIDNTTTLNAIKHVSMTQNCQELENKVAALQSDNDRLSRLNEKLSELKSSPCSQCARFKKLYESRKPIALEVKTLNRKLNYLQKKFDRERAHIEVLKNQELSLSFDRSLNASFADTLNLSFVEEKVQHLNNELQTVREMYEEKCDDFKKLCDTMSVEGDCKLSKKEASEVITLIEEMRRSINEAREELNEIKKDVAKFKAEKVSLLEQINKLEDVNKQLSLEETSATKRVKILEDAMEIERMKFVVELECLNLDKESGDKHIDELNHKINDLNERIKDLRTNLTEKESSCEEQRSKIFELNRLLEESNNEKDTLKAKVQALELKIGNLQSELDEQYKVVASHEDEIVVAHKREKEIHEAFKHREDELQLKIKAEKELFEKKIDELSNAIETYKTKNMNLRSIIENLEADEKQLMNIVEANISELKVHNQSIRKVSHDFDQLTETYNELSDKLEDKKSTIKDITVLLKNKCDMLSEYKNKLETIEPHYKMLQSQAEETRESIERYKEEIRKLTMERDKEIETIKHTLNSELIKNIGLVKQLNELNNEHTALTKELNNLKEEHRKLRETVTKLERKVRSGMNKTKVEASLEELRDLNKRLQNNLEGASNRISELQESKNNVLRELVNLKDQYESLCQENAELKKMLSSCISEQYSSRLSQENSKYDELVQEKNKIALELEDNKLLLTQKGKEISECVRQIEELTAKKVEFDNQLKEWSIIIHERDSEILQLKSKLNTHQVANELKEKCNFLKTETENLDKQVKAFETKSQVEREEMESTKFQNENILCTLKKECSELQRKLSDYEIKLEPKSRNGDSRSTSPFENRRRRRSRNEMFNQKRHLETVTMDMDVDDEETCRVLRKKIQELGLELVSKNGQIAALQLQIQSENFAYEQKCKDLKEEMHALRRKNDELRTELRKLQRILIEVSARDCERCRRWKLSKRDQGCQTTDDELLFFNTDNGIIRDHGNLMKMEKEYALVKDTCRAQRRRIQDLENKLKESEDVQKNCN